jgi:hypothetical protein
MVSLGSRTFLGTAAFALVAALAYLGSAGDRTGVALFLALLVAAVVGALGLLGRTRAETAAATATAAADAAVERRDLPAAEAEGASVWPVVAALAAGIAAVGFVVSEPLAWVGLGLGGVAAAGWYGQGWRRANPASYALFHQRVLMPLRIPIGGAARCIPAGFSTAMASAL